MSSSRCGSSTPDAWSTKRARWKASAAAGTSPISAVHSASRYQGSTRESSSAIRASSCSTASASCWSSISRRAPATLKSDEGQRGESGASAPQIVKLCWSAARASSLRHCEMRNDASA
eukprot:Amastigsp_a340529_106.p4 type:complete len:118 gc:universal Amastigsp_a340529_106:171-524(+)